MVEPRRLYSIGLFTSSERDKDTQLNVLVADKHFKIDLFAASFEGSPYLLQEYLRHVKRQEPEYTFDDIDMDAEFEDPLDEMHDWVLKPFLPIFCDISPLDPNRKYTIEDCLYADELHYTVQVEDSRMVPVFLGRNDRKKNGPIGAQLPTEFDLSAFLQFHPREVHITMDPDST